MIRGLLVVLSAVALLVASSSLHNTFSIVVAQRTRESALLKALIEASGFAALPTSGLVVNTTAVVASFLVGVVARLTGPIAARPVAAVLARDNAKRTRAAARTASALMVDIGVVTLITVSAASVKASIDDVVSESFTGDVAVNAGVFGGSGFSPDLATSISRSPVVETAVGLRRARRRSKGRRRRSPSSIPPSWRTSPISASTAARSRNSAIPVSRSRAASRKDKGGHVGRPGLWCAGRR